MLVPGYAVAGMFTSNCCPSGDASCTVIPGPIPGGTVNPKKAGGTTLKGVYSTWMTSVAVTEVGTGKDKIWPSGVVTCSSCPAHAPVGMVTSKVAGPGPTDAASRDTLESSIVASVC